MRAVKQGTEPKAGQRPLYRRWEPFLALLLALLLLALLVLAPFRVQQVQVVGTHMPPEEIAQAGGIKGQNIFTIESDEVVSRLQSVRSIAVGRVEVSFPNKVTVYARDRAPLVAAQVGRTLYELDVNGQVVRETKQTALPIVLVSGPKPELSTSIIRAVPYARRVLDGSPATSVLNMSASVNQGLTINGAAGWHAIIGSGSFQTLSNRIQTLRSLSVTARDQSKRLRFVDLRYRLPYARFSPP